MIQYGIKTLLKLLVLTERAIDFADLHDLFSLPYIEDQKSDDPEQYRIVGVVAGVLTTFIVEYRQDSIGEFVWVVTAWRSTKQESKAYDEEIYD